MTTLSTEQVPLLTHVACQRVSYSPTGRWWVDDPAVPEHTAQDPSFLHGQGLLSLPGPLRTQSLAWLTAAGEQALP